MSSSAKRIVIVGASSGLGRLAAESFARMGWKVGAAARNLAELEKLKSQFPDNIEITRIDVTDAKAAESLHALIDKVGGMDVYFHVSGICIENPSLDIDSEVRTAETNVVGFTRMIDAAFRYFRDNSLRGHIAALTSVAGTKGIADLAAYSAGKRYQWNYIEALEQLARREKADISFTDIRPGWTKTPLIDSSRTYLMAMKPEKVAKKIVSAVVKKKRVAVIDLRWALMYGLWRLLPSRLWTRIPLHSSK